MTACSEPPPSDVRAVLGVELHGLLLREDDAVPQGAQVIEVGCSGDAAELSVRGTSSQRTVSLASVPSDLRARLLALSIAELARPQPTAAVPEPEPIEPDPEPPAAVVSERAVEVEQEPRRYFLWAGVDAQATPLAGAGGALQFRTKLGEYFAWSSTLGLAQARTEIDRGDLRVLSLSLRTGVAFLVQSSEASFHAGAGVRGSWQRLSGEPADLEDTSAAHFDAWSIGPAVFAGGTWQLVAPVFIALELELAHALRETRANVTGGDARTLSPWLTSAALGAGVAW